MSFRRVVLKYLYESTRGLCTAAAGNDESSFNCIHVYMYIIYNIMDSLGRKNRARTQYSYLRNAYEPVRSAVEMFVMIFIDDRSLQSCLKTKTV